MAVAEVAASTAYASTTGTSYNGSINYTAVGGANHVAVFMCTFGGDPGTISTKTWNGTTVTQIGTTVSNGTNNFIAFYYLLNPAAGNNNFNLVWTNSVVWGFTAVEFSGVDGTTPVSDFTSATGTSANPAVTVPNTVSGDGECDSMTTNGTSYSSQTPGTTISNNNAAYTMASAYQLASSTSVTDTYSTFGSTAWLCAGVRVRQIAGGGDTFANFSRITFM